MNRTRKRVGGVLKENHPMPPRPPNEESFKGKNNINPRGMKRPAHIARVSGGPNNFRSFDNAPPSPPPVENPMNVTAKSVRPLLREVTLQREVTQEPLPVFPLTKQDKDSIVQQILAVLAGTPTEQYEQTEVKELLSRTDRVTDKFLNDLIVLFIQNKRTESKEESTENLKYLFVFMTNQYGIHNTVEAFKVIKNENIDEIKEILSGAPGGSFEEISSIYPEKDMYEFYKKYSYGKNDLFAHLTKLKHVDILRKEMKELGYEPESEPSIESSSEPSSEKSMETSKEETKEGTLNKTIETLSTQLSLIKEINRISNLLVYVKFTLYQDDTPVRKAIYHVDSLPILKDVLELLLKLEIIFKDKWTDEMIGKTGNKNSLFYHLLSATKVCLYLLENPEDLNDTYIKSIRKALTEWKKIKGRLMEPDNVLVMFTNETLEENEQAFKDIDSIFATLKVQEHISATPLKRTSEEISRQVTPGPSPIRTFDNSWNEGNVQPAKKASTNNVKGPMTKVVSQVMEDNVIASI